MYFRRARLVVGDDVRPVGGVDPVDRTTERRLRLTGKRTGASGSSNRRSELTTRARRSPINSPSRSIHTSRSPFIRSRSSDRSACRPVRRRAPCRRRSSSNISATAAVVVGPSGWSGCGSSPAIIARWKRSRRRRVGWCPDQRGDVDLVGGLVDRYTRRRCRTKYMCGHAIHASSSVGDTGRSTRGTATHVRSPSYTVSTSEHGARPLKRIARCTARRRRLPHWLRPGLRRP